MVRAGAVPAVCSAEPLHTHVTRARLCVARRGGDHTPCHWTRAHPHADQPHARPCSHSCSAALAESLYPGLATAERVLLHRALKSLWLTHWARCAAAAPAARALREPGGVAAAAPLLPLCAAAAGAAAAAAGGGVQGRLACMLTGGGGACVMRRPCLRGLSLSSGLNLSACVRGHTHTHMRGASSAVPTTRAGATRGGRGTTHLRRRLVPAAAQAVKRGVSHHQACRPGCFRGRRCRRALVLPAVTPEVHRLPEGGVLGEEAVGRGAHNGAKGRGLPRVAAVPRLLRAAT
jgi:hypothetical protein